MAESCKRTDTGTRTDIHVKVIETGPRLGDLVNLEFRRMKFGLQNTKLIESIVGERESSEASNDSAKESHRCLDVSGWARLDLLDPNFFFQLSKTASHL